MLACQRVVQDVPQETEGHSWSFERAVPEATSSRLNWAELEEETPLPTSPGVLGPVLAPSRLSSPA